MTFDSVLYTYVGAMFSSPLASQEMIEVRRRGYASGGTTRIQHYLRLDLIGLISSDRLTSDQLACQYFCPEEEHASQRDRGGRPRRATYSHLGGADRRILQTTVETQ